MQKNAASQHDVALSDRSLFFHKRALRVSELGGTCARDRESRQNSTAALAEGSDLIHGEVEAVGEVEATDEAHALAKAAEQFKVPASKLIAVKRT